MSLDVAVSDAAPDAWDEYVRAHRHACRYQLADAVSIGRRVFGFRTYFLHARDAGGTMTGVLPLVEQAGILGGRTLVSLPFFNYGGILANDAASATALAEAAADLARSRRVKQAELRQAQALCETGWSARLDKITMLLTLPDTVDALSKALGSKLRSQIKRAERESPSVKVGGVELVEEFYPVFCSVMRDLGTPVYPRRFFEDVIATFGPDAHLVVVSVSGKPVSAAVLVRFRDTIEVPWAATLNVFRTTSINMRLYWELLQLAVARNCRQFDFGRSTVGSGTHRFKEQWGAVPAQLHWLRSGVAMDAIAEGAKFTMAVKLWSKLPLPVANVLGPMISPRLPW